MPILIRRASDVVVPYCASVAWYRHSPEAVVAARRRPNRALFADDTLLTVPVEGGARILKSHARDAGVELRVSDHGRWSHVHLGALEALYGRTPFFAHYFPAVADVISSPHELLVELTGSIDRIIAEALRFDTLLPLLKNPSEVVAAEADRMYRRVKADVPMLEALFRFGPEAIFLLVER